LREDRPHSNKKCQPVCQKYRGQPDYGADAKEKGVEIYFEKENIWTLDAKGELLITIMSSLAQEESRSISENTTWGQRTGSQMARQVWPTCDSWAMTGGRMAALWSIRTGKDRQADL
jgi:hypothetical protein